MIPRLSHSEKFSTTGSFTTCDKQTRVKATASERTTHKVPTYTCLPHLPERYDVTRNFSAEAHVLVREVEATIARYERGELLSVLDQLNAHALTDSGVRLLRLNTAAHPRLQTFQPQ